MMISAEVLYKVRKVYRLSQAEIGLLCNVSDAYINQIENGNRRITERVQRGIVKELDLTPNKLARILAIYNEFSTNTA